MKVKIEIECETGGELKMHLFTLVEQLNAEAKRIKTIGGVVKKPTVLHDNNCYGDHKMTIRDFTGDDLTEGISYYKLSRKLKI